MYTYNWYQWLSFFYIYCFFGWIFESVYVSIKERRFVNRGFLRIPMLPLYGFGAVMMLWVSLPVKNNLALVYLSGVIAATILEYVTGSVMEQLFKIRYWDYSNQKFQFHGYICLSSSIAWGFLTILMTEVIHEPVAGIVLSLNQNVLFYCVIIISAVFAVDVFESTREALALGKALESMTRLKAEMEDLQMKIASIKEEAAEHITLARETQAERLTAAVEGTAVRLSAVKDGAAERLTAAREKTALQMSKMKHSAACRLSAVKDETVKTFSDAKSQTAELLSSQLERAGEKRRALQSQGPIRHFYRKGLLRGNPGAVSSRFSEALKELQKRL